MGSLTMPEDLYPESGSLILARGLAFFLDGLGLLILFSQLGWFGLLLAPLLFIMIAKWGTSPGKFLLGLRLDLPAGPFNLRFERLMTRELIKYGLFALSGGLLLLIIKLMNKLFFETLLMIVLAILIWPILIILPHLRFKKFSSSLKILRHEQLSGVGVIPVKVGQPSGLRQVFFSFVFILCNGILILVLLPNNNSRKDRAKVSSVKANMHLFQTLVETYAVDHQSYPENVRSLRQEASGPYAYWKEFDNPFTAEWGEGKAYLNEGSAAMPGAVSYQPLAFTHGKYLAYVIYGYDQQGRYVLNHQQPFKLESNLESERQPDLEPSAKQIKNISTSSKPGQK